MDAGDTTGTEASGSGTDARFAEVWRANRARLVDLAFGMLADIAEAEDVAQEAFARLLVTEPGEVRDETGWLVVVTTRLCLDQLRSARVKRVSGGVGADDRHEPPAAAPGGRPALADPQDRVTLDDTVQHALLVVLQRLTPAERVAFVLHDVFAMPFEEIGDTVGRSAASCRQLARRARQRIADESGRQRFAVAPVEHRSVTERFMTACREGDVAALVSVLDPDAAGRADFGPSGPPPGARAGAPRGARRLAATFMRYWAGATLVSDPTSAEPTLLAYLDGSLAGIVQLTIEDGAVHDVHVVVDPERLDALRTELAYAREVREVTSSAT